MNMPGAQRNPTRSRHHARFGIDPQAACLADKHPGINLRQYVAARGEALAYARGDRRPSRFEAAMVARLNSIVERLRSAGRDWALQARED